MPVTNEDAIAAVEAFAKSRGTSLTPAQAAAYALGFLSGVREWEASGIGADGTDPLKHSSGMFLRWDPTHPTAPEGQAAWAALLEEYESLPGMDPATGAAAQMERMIKFDSSELPWEESSDNVVPSSGEKLTAAKLTKMLRGGGHIGATATVKTLEKVPLALQGVLSQTFKLVLTYEGETSEGLPSEFIAKFLNPDPGFAFFRFVCGSTGIESFKVEDWCYSTEFFGMNGIRQPKCYFTSYDPQRETFCLILEDMGAAGFTVGDQLSGGPAKDQPPDLAMYKYTMDSLASFNARRLNKCCGEFTDGGGVSHNLAELVPALNHPFLMAVWPMLSGSISATAPDIFESAGIIMKEDPFWETVNGFLPRQAEFFQACASFKETGGLYNATIAHGDARSENVFFPASEPGHPAFIDYQLLRRTWPEFDCVYFIAQSLPQEFRRQHELELMNVYYDVLIAKSGEDPEEYSWEVFCMQAQLAVVFLTLALIFLAPEVASSASPDADPRKKKMVGEMAMRLKTAVEDWGGATAEPVVIDAVVARAKLSPTPPQSEWSKEAPALVPAKYLNGRNPKYYQEHLKATAAAAAAAGQ